MVTYLKVEILAHSFKYLANYFLSVFPEPATMQDIETA